MIEKEYAIEVRNHSLNAISELTRILHIMQGKCTEQEFAGIKKAVGLSIGRIQTDILDFITKAYPDLDDLK